MKNRNGEKLGWLGGWSGGFLWLLILAVVWIVKGRTAHGIVGLSVAACATLAIILLAPWRRPRTPYWILITPIYFLLFLAVAIVIRFEGGLKTLGLNWWNSLWILILFMPYMSIGNKRWRDDDLDRRP